MRYLIAALVFVGVAAAQDTGLYTGADTFTTDGAAGADSITIIDGDYYTAEQIKPELPEPSWWSRYWEYVIAILGGLFAATLVTLGILESRRGERATVNRAEYYEEDETETCGFCGRVYEGYNCPGCGAPRRRRWRTQNEVA